MYDFARIPCSGGLAVSAVEGKGGSDGLLHVAALNNGTETGE